MKIDDLTVILCQFVFTTDETTIHSEDGSENDEYNPEDNEIGNIGPQNI